MIFEKIQGKNNVIHNKIKGKEVKSYISTQTDPQFGAKGNCLPVANILFAPCRPPARFAVLPAPQPFKSCAFEGYSASVQFP